MYAGQMARKCVQAVWMPSSGNSTRNVLFGLRTGAGTATRERCSNPLFLGSRVKGPLRQSIPYRLLEPTPLSANEQFCRTQTSEEKARNDVKHAKTKGFAIPTAAAPQWENIKGNIDKITKQMPGSMDEVKQKMNDIPDWKEIYDKGLGALPDLNKAKTAPQSVLILSGLGILPFVWAPWHFLTTGYFSPGYEFMQLAYGATMLAALGGLRFGIMMKESNISTENLSLSVGLTTVSWVGLLLPPFFGNIFLITGLSTAAYMDLLSPAYPDWYKVVRFLFTAAAVGSLLLTLLFKMFLKQKPKPLDKSHRQ